MPVRRRLAPTGLRALLDARPPASVEQCGPLLSGCSCDVRRHPRYHRAYYSGHARRLRAHPEASVKSFPSAKIRNVALVGHGGAGKTTLAEALLFCAGCDQPAWAGSRTAPPSPTSSPRSSSAAISLSLALAPFEWKGHKINLIDSPGYADFIGDVARRAARGRPRRVRGERGRGRRGPDRGRRGRSPPSSDLPRMIFVNKLDRERASFERTLDQLRDTFGAGVAPLELPIGEEAAFHGVADLLTDTAYHLRRRQGRRRARSPTRWRRSSTRCTTTSSRASSSPTTTCSSATSRATSPSPKELEDTLAKGVADAPGVPGRLRLGDQAASPSTGWPTSSARSARRPLDRPPVTVDGRRHDVEVACDPNGEPLALRVQDDRRPVRRQGLAVQGAVGHDPARRPS